MASSIEEIRQQLIEQKARQAASATKPESPQGATTAPSSVGAAPSPVPTAAKHATVNTLPPWLLPTQPEATASSATAQTATTPPASAVPVLEPSSRRSSPPISVPTFTRFFKLCISAAILLAGSYFAVKNAYPFLRELAQPGSVKIANTKDAPTSVKILQQTREVVAKNNANVDNLNAIINDPLGASIPAAPPIAPLPAAPVSPKPKPQVRLEPLAGLVLDDLHVSGVHGGRDPRIMVDGLMVHLGGVVDSKRRLRFISLDEARRVIVFGNGVETVEKSY